MQSIYWWSNYTSEIQINHRLIRLNRFQLLFVITFMLALSDHIKVLRGISSRNKNFYSDYWLASSGIELWSLWVIVHMNNNLINFEHIIHDQIKHDWSYLGYERLEFPGCCQNKAKVRRRWSEWSGQVFWMILDSHVEGVVVQFNDLHSLLLHIRSNELWRQN